ncbi:MAG: PAS domain S-box protein [Fidelibacterota bacterium]|nr:MAG: PAS domain S-box protein [Candidatus Neomarinimicrobiota bacterium]
MNDRHMTKAQLLEELERVRHRAAELETVEKELRQSEERFRQFFESEPEYCYMVSPEGTILNVNHAALTTLGYQKEELVGKPLRVIYAPETVPRMKRLFKTWQEEGVIKDEELVIVTKKGARRNVLLSAGVVRDPEGKIVHSVSVQRDITQRKRAEEKLQKAHDELELRVTERTSELEDLTKDLRREISERQQAEKNLNRLNRAYRMVSECNQVVIRMSDEKSLLDRICNIIVATGGYRLTWVGFAQHDEAKTVRPVASAGNAKGYLENIHITWADEPKGRGPTGTAIRTGQPSPARNIPTDPQFAPWREEAIKRGYASSLALPLRIDHENIGALNIYASEPEAFDEWEVSLLVNLADNLAYGINSLRTRKERNRAEAELRELSKQLRNLTTHLQSIREEERTSIAREIHDELGQAIMALKFKLMNLKTTLPADQVAHIAEVDAISKQIDGTAKIVNRIATHLRPTLIDELGLGEAIEWEVEQFQDRTGIACELTYPEGMDLSKEYSTAIYRITQEALTNIARHAQASQCTVKLKISDNKLVLGINDNGIGIPEQEILSPTSLGIIGMRERVLSVDGKFEIKGIEKKGTTIKVTVSI